MKRVNNLYKDISNFNNIIDMSYKVCKRVRNKKKVDKFESFYSEHIYHIYNRLKNKDFNIGNYHIFMINDPKCRIVMSQDIEDKIINHLVSYYALKKVFDSKFTNILCATREGYGTIYGIRQVKRYLIKMKNKYSNFYILKIDIHKYFYSIDHDILKNILRHKIKDKDVLQLLDNIIDSTNNSYINNKIIELKRNRINYLRNSNLNNKYNLIKEVEEIPLYKENEGVALGNESSQVFGLIYLYEIAHYLKEELKLSRVIIYMDDFIMIHQDKEYLKYCLDKIISKLKEYKLEINKKKTRIDSIRNGVDFLGYRFFFYHKIIIRLRNRTKKKYKKKIKNIGLLYRKEYINDKVFIKELNSYHGILKWGNCKRLEYKKEVIKILEKYYKYKVDYKDYICFLKIGSFYEVLDNDALIINKIFYYKVKIISNTFKVGFPIKMIDNVLDRLEELNINYIVVDNNNIKDKYNNENNKYQTYQFDNKYLYYQSIRINNIIKYLDNNRSSDIRNILDRIEEIMKE